MDKGRSSGTARGRARPTRDRVGFVLIGCVLLGGVGLVLGACAVLLFLNSLFPPVTPYPAAITRAEILQQYPEYGLYYPGATVLDRGGGDAELRRFDATSASASVELGADGSREAIIAFYARELAARGWQVSDIYISDTIELDARAWRKGQVVFRLGFRDPRRLATPVGYGTTYGFVLRADNPDDPAWQTLP